MEIVRLEKTDSTNTWVAANEDKLPSLALVYCIEQTSGRGQRGNSWESSPEKNITASLLFHPVNFPAPQQFRISETVALALVDYLREKGVEAKVKWPNDIYVGNKKICGILVEHVVMGKNITRTIAGFGLNINQEVFLSDAPNPVSLTQLTGLEYEIEKEIGLVAAHIEKRLHRLDKVEIHDEFLNNLWRNDGLPYHFLDKIRSEKIQAVIGGVGSDGMLVLSMEGDEERRYAFKEVEFIIDE